MSYSKVKAVIRLDVPEWQIGQETTVYFPDTMCKKSVCEKDEIIYCQNCRFYSEGENEIDAWMRCRLHRINVSPDEFCSWAVEK